MKVFLLLLMSFAARLSCHAQLVFRNVGTDTIRIAVGTFYDTSWKAIMASAGKPIVVTGWYLLHPGDSLVQSAFPGPAVYYSKEIIRDNRYVIGDTIFLSESERTIANYREHFCTGYNRPLSDTTKFRIKHPYKIVCEPTKMVMSNFRIALVSDEAKRNGRLLIELGRRPGR